ncbi:unnamed protein product, partial [Laminaria digitata]
MACPEVVSKWVYHCSEKTIAILGDRWWSQTAKQVGEKISETFRCNIPVWKTRSECLNVGGVSIRS